MTENRLHGSSKIDTGQLGDRHCKFDRPRIVPVSVMKSDLIDLSINLCFHLGSESMKTNGKLISQRVARSWEFNLKACVNLLKS